MPYIYDNSPDWREKSASAFTDSFKNSLEAAMLRKNKKKDEAEALEQQLAIAGYKEIPEGANVEEYESSIDLGGRKLGKPLSEYQKTKRAQEAEQAEYEKSLRPMKEAELAMKGRGTPVMIWNPAKNAYDTIEGGGSKAPKVINPPSDLPARKFQVAQEEKEAEKEAKGQLVRDSAQDMLNTISKVREGMDYFGLRSVVQPTIPGSKKATWEANIDKLLSGRVLNLLNQMKAASRTGATGFGQLSEKELKVLQDASTALKKSLNKDEAQSILNDMELQLMNIVGGGAQPSQPLQQDNADPVIRTGTDKITGKKVGMTQSGKIIPLE